MNKIKDIYKGKKVLITGHTGFKGSWLSMWLTKLGADVMTGPLSSILGLLKHPLTDIGLAKFLEDYKKGN